MKLTNKIIPILLLISPLAVGQQVDSRKPIGQLLDSIAVTQMQSFEIPGLAIGFVMDNEIVYSKGFGVQSLRSHTLVTDSSLFHMASVSKPFVATAVLQLIKKEKVALDSPLVSCLPYFRMNDPRYTRITLRHILSHSSGIPDVRDYEWDKPQYDDGSAERFVRSFADKTLDFSPGERFRYSNAGYDILADVIAKAAGVTFEEYVKKNILEPVGMINSTFLKTEVPEHLATSPHVLDSCLSMSVSPVYPYNRMHAPSSTLHSNLRDMLRWARMMLNGGFIDGNRIISKRSYDMLTTAQITKGKQDSMCLGWHLSYIGGKRMYSHTGGDIGYSTFFAFLPEDSIAVVVMGNNRLYWGGDPAYICLNRILLNKNVDYWIKPIHYELRKTILSGGIGDFKEKYCRAKEDTPQKLQFEPWCLDELGHWLMERKHVSKAIDVLKFNVELYPDSAACRDSLGDAYRMSGNRSEAIQCYESALRLDPDRGSTRRKLAETKDGH